MSKAPKEGETIFRLCQSNAELGNYVLDLQMKIASHQSVIDELKAKIDRQENALKHAMKRLNENAPDFHVSSYIHTVLNQEKHQTNE